MFVASSSSKKSKEKDSTANRKSCWLKRRDLDRSRITIKTWNSTRDLISRVRSWMRRQSSVTNTTLKHWLLIWWASIVYLHQISSSRTKLRMLQRRRRCLYTLTYSTSLTLVFTTSKKVFNSLLQRLLWRYLFIFFVNAF